MTTAPPVVLTIAGYDPSSGAGVTADIKTIAAHCCFGVSSITALTVQSTQGVRRVEPVSADLVKESLCELARDIEIAAIHVGMLGSAAVADAVADFLQERSFAAVVIDPVIKSSSGAELLGALGVEVLRRRLFSLATVITPNLEEAAMLTGVRVEDLAGMRTAAQRLHSMGAAKVIVTGGHLQQPVDLLSTDGGAHLQEFPGKHIESRTTHGTGCAFATALACNLAMERPLPEAVRRAGEYVRMAIATAYPIGRGRGPLHHLHALENLRGVD